MNRREFLRSSVGLAALSSCAPPSSAAGGTKVPQAPLALSDQARAKLRAMWDASWESIRWRQDRYKTGGIVGSDERMDGGRKLYWPWCWPRDFIPGYGMNHNTCQIIPENATSDKERERGGPVRFKPGNIVFSYRSVDVIGVIDRATGRIVWAWGPGEIDGQHKPHVLANGNILIFDNGTLRRYERKGRGSWQTPGQRFCCVASWASWPNANSMEGQTP